MGDHTVQKVLEATRLDSPDTGKRPRVDLAGPSGVSKKGGPKVLPSWWIKTRPGDAADAAGQGDAAGHAPAAEVATPLASPHATPRSNISSAKRLARAARPRRPHVRGRSRPAQSASSLGFTPIT